jgi:hypothetical protein
MYNLTLTAPQGHMTRWDLRNKRMNKSAPAWAPQASVDLATALEARSSDVIEVMGSGNRENPYLATLNYFHNGRLDSITYVGTVGTLLEIPLP